MKIQLTSGPVVEMEEHALTGRDIIGKSPGTLGQPGTVLGIRAGVKANRRNAFVVRYGAGTALQSRVHFKVVE